MERAFPIVAPIRELRTILDKLRLSDLAVGKDGRNRCMLSPFRARSGRNRQISRSSFRTQCLALHVYPPGTRRALAYIDFASQEIAIAAALSGDEMMLRAYQSGDPSLAFAIDAKLAPANATKSTHKDVRNRCKALVLGTLYGMGEKTLAENLNLRRSRLE